MDLKQLEEISLIAWPALQETSYDGWLLRFSEGYTKRANSINSVQPSGFDLEEKVSHCERIYRNRNLPPIFRITPFVSPKNLDNFLEERGYEKIDPTRVLTLNLFNLEFQPTLQGKFQSLPLDQWLEIFCAFRSDSLDDHQAHNSILSAIPTPKLFATLSYENHPVACGVGSIVKSNFGMFDLLTHPNQRGKGFGTSLVISMLGWAQERAARMAYVQVLEDNDVAMQMYRKFGFERAYSYCYRKSSF